MNIEFEATYYFNNHEEISKIIKEDVLKSYLVTKGKSDTLELSKNEVVLFHILGAKFNRTYKTNYSSKHEMLKEHRITRKQRTDSELIEVEIYITNKYVYLLYNNNLEKININKIHKIYVSKSNVEIYLKGKNYCIILNSLKIALQVVLLIDVVSKSKLDDTFVGKNINIEL
ncbi:MAG: hypothetical protein ACK5K7_01680 [Bacilli bacterium]